MKRLLLIAGVFFIAYVVFTSVVVPNDNTQKQEETQPESIVVQSPTEYTVKAENNRVVVYLDDALYLKTSTVVSSLPKSDQKSLLYGIKANSKSELNSILEDYCS